MMHVYATREEWNALVMLAALSPDSALWAQAGNVLMRAAAGDA